MIHPARPENITKAADLLRSGELVAFPTETVYGLGANALDAKAVAKIFAAKGRPPTNPLIVHLASLGQLKLAVDPRALSQKRELINKLSCFWPGPLTLVLPKLSSVPDIVSAGKLSVGVRIPNHPVALALLREAKVPIAAPSANRSTKVSPTCAAHVAASFGPELAMILDGGACKVGIESTVLSLLSDVPTLLRPGAITLEDLRSVLPKINLDPGISAKGLSPGQMPEHYSPNTPIAFREGFKGSKLRVGLIAFSRHSAAGEYAEIRVLSETGDLSEVAQHLFATIRELDGLNLDLILIDSCAEEGIGLAIMDRLRRATAAFKGKV